MAGPVQTIEQTPFPGVPQAEGWGTITRAWVDDLLTRDVPASIVILIIVVIYLPKLLSMVSRFWHRGS